MPADLPVDPRPGAPSPEQLIAAMSALLAEEDTSAGLHAVAASAMRLVPEVDGASISLLIRSPEGTFVHPRGALPALLDAIEADVGEGPGFDATTTEQPVRVPDLHREQRWPQFADRARQTGARSILSVRLAAGDDSLGALTLCSRQPDAFDDEAERTALLLAAHAALAITAARTIAGLRVALAGRDLIGQAKGILMERYSIDADQAFSFLVRVSQNEHRKLRDLAGELTITRTLDNLQA